jgi:transposase
MARAFLIGAYRMQEIAEHFGVHSSTVSRAVRRFECAAGSAAPQSGDPMSHFRT